MAFSSNSSTNSDSSASIGDYLPSGLNAIPPDEAKKVFTKIQKDFPILKGDFDKNKELIDKLKNRNTLEEFWDWLTKKGPGQLGEEKDKLTFLLTKASLLQLDAVNALLCLSVLIGRMANKLKEQQNTIIKQQDDLKTANQKLATQQEALATQQTEIEKIAKDIFNQNERLIQNSEELKALRKIG